MGDDVRSNRKTGWGGVTAHVRGSHHDHGFGFVHRVPLSINVSIGRMIASRFNNSSERESTMPTRARTHSGSRFDVLSMPSAIHRRTLHQYSVHCSPTTGNWIATITRGGGDGYSEARRTVQFPFKSEREARKFAKSYTPPKMLPESSACMVCNSNFDHRNRAHFCRNCGVCVCDGCSCRWGIRMVPKTYANTPHSLTVRVCSSCDWLSNAFCLALLQGRSDDAKQLFDTGNVNLRTSFAGINGEAMFPVHCAVMGGNVDILKWLVDTQCCPIAVQRDGRGGKLMSVQTSSDRSLVDLAMTGKPKLDILRYLIMEKNMSVTDTKDANLAPKALEALLRAGGTGSAAAPSAEPLTTVHIVEDGTDGSLTTIEDACKVCFEAPMDCVLVPCGHQVCCAGCGKQLDKCPVCKVSCTVLRIFRQ